MKFQCPECEATMELKEDNHVCPKCKHEMSLTEAESEFDKGNLVGLVEDSEVEDLLDEAKKIVKKEDGGDKELEDDEKKKDEIDEDGDEDEKDDDEIDEDEDSEDDKKAKKIKKEADMKKAKKESVENSLKNIEIDIQDDIKSLFGKEDLSEEFKSKAGTVYETAIRSNLRTIAESIVEENSKRLETEIKKNKEELAEKLDTYLKYVVGTWMEENKVALESNVRVEMNDNFMEGLSALFTEHWIEVPEGRYDVLEGMAKENANLKEQLDEEIEKNINHQSVLNESVKREILSEISEDLADTEKEKLIKLSEEIKYESEEQFREKISTIKEGYFSKTSRKDGDGEEEDNNNQLENRTDNDMISNVLNALKSSNKDNV